jgi:DNA modification methylase
VCDSKDVIVAGHKRLLAAQKLGLTQVPVHVALGLTAAQCKAYRLMDNRSNQYSEWDMEMLQAEMQELVGKIDTALTGFEAAEVEKMLKDVTRDGDLVPPAPSEQIAKLGDVWLLGEHRVVCGDCTPPDVVGALLGERKPFLMVTDPPYGIELDSEWRDRAGLNKNGKAEPSYMKKRTAGHNETTISGDTRSDWSEAFELVPSLEVAYVWHAAKFTREVLDGLLRIGFLHWQQIIWAKSQAVLMRTLYWYQHEPCWFVRKKNAPWYGKAGECKSIWNAISPKMIMGGSDEVKYDHPTQKPVELMKTSVLNHTKRGELVYEPFLGSGTTLAACELTGRVCVGIELDPKYVDVVIARWELMTGKKAVREELGGKLAKKKGNA